MDAKSITVALKGKWAGRYGLARCPVHADKTPSLKVMDDPRKDDGIDLHCFAGCNWRAVKDALVAQRLLPEFTPGHGAFRLPPKVQCALPTPADDTAQRVDLALKIWKVSVPLKDTLGWRYFTERRGLHIGLFDDLSHVLRWHEGFRAVTALMTDAVTNEPTGIHRTFLNIDGAKLEKKMLGQWGVVRLSADERVTHGLGICEGIEDGLSILLNGWAPIWVATSAGAIAKFPVLGGIESLTLFHDDDDAGTRAAETCAQRWNEAEREVRFSTLRDALA